MPKAAWSNSTSFSLARVRRVVGGDAVDRAVGERLAQRLDVALGAQRRAHLASVS